MTSSLEHKRSADGTEEHWFLRINYGPGRPALACLVATYFPKMDLTVWHERKED